MFRFCFENITKQNVWQRRILHMYISLSAVRYAIYEIVRLYIVCKSKTQVAILVIAVISSSFCQSFIRSFSRVLALSHSGSVFLILTRSLSLSPFHSWRAQKIYKTTWPIVLINNLLY